MSSDRSTGNHPLKIIVMGEDSSSMKGLTGLLSDDGFHAVFCNNPDQALSSLASADVMIIEHLLPDEHLVGILTRITKKDSRIPVFVITPYSDIEQKLAESAIFPKECFNMPLIYEDLHNSLKEYMEEMICHESAEPETLSAEFIAKLDRQGPRYTSYPTAPVFSSEFSSEDYSNALFSAGSKKDLFSIYVHLPFCRSMCTYCACSVTVRKDIGHASSEYVDRLLKEAEIVSGIFGKQRKVAELHLGGGTPNYFPPEQIEKLMKGLESRFSFAPGAVRGIEVDPRHIDDYGTDQLQWLADTGFTRVSIGIQDIEDRVQKEIGRIQTLDATLKTFETAKQAGFDSINFDLVYGLPAQTRESFRNTIKQVIEMGPDRLAIFSFAYVPAHKPTQKRLNISKALSGKEKSQLLLDALKEFSSAGYIRVGMDHFAKPGDPLARSFRDGTLHRNFQGYVPGPPMELIGLGLTSIGDVGGVYTQNHRMLREWEKAVDSGILPVARGWRRTFDDEVRRFVIQSLMCRFRLSYSLLADNFGIEHDRYFEKEKKSLDDLSEQGLIEFFEDGIKLTPQGRLFVRNVAMVYDAYLPDMKSSFSRTV